MEEQKYSEERLTGITGILIKWMKIENQLSIETVKKTHRKSNLTQKAHKNNIIFVDFRLSRPASITLVCTFGLMCRFRLLKADASPLITVAICSENFTTVNR